MHRKLKLIKQCTQNMVDIKTNGSKYLYIHVYIVSVNAKEYRPRVHIDDSLYKSSLFAI